MNCTIHPDRKAIDEIIEVAPEDQTRWQAGQQLCRECLREFNRSSADGVVSDHEVPAGSVRGSEPSE
jgi:hypothetical protein